MVGRFSMEAFDYGPRTLCIEFAAVQKTPSREFSEPSTETPFEGTPVRLDHEDKNAD